MLLDPPPRELSSSPTLLSPKQLARVVGVSESSLKRWIDNGQLTSARTQGGHRRVPLAEALRFIRVHGHAIHDPSPLGLATISIDGGVSLTDRLYRALTLADWSAARTLLVSAYAAGQSIPELCEGPIRSAMERVGELWQHEDAGIAIEHQATDTCLQAMNILRTFLSEPPPDAPVALGGAPAKDPYLLPSLMAALTFTEIGFKSINLGADTPLESLRIAALRQQARLVWVSVSTQEATGALRQPLLRLADELATHGASLLVGGRTAHEIGLELRPNLLRSRSLSEAAAFARGLLSRR